METIKKNIMLLGDGAVGKTSLIRRFVTDQFSDKYITTIGSKVTKKDVYLGGVEDRTHMIMLVWDILGQKGYKYTQALSFGGIEAALLVADVTRIDTLYSLKEYWIPSLMAITGPVPLIFLGNKADLKDDMAFGIEDLEELASEIEPINGKYECRLTSAKTGENVEDSFISMANYLKNFTMKATTGTLDGASYIIDKSEISSLMDVTDHIIADFCNQFGGVENASPIIKHQIDRIGLDINNPDKRHLVELVNNLAHVEKDFKPSSQVSLNRTKRLYLINHH